MNPDLRTIAAGTVTAFGGAILGNGIAYFYGLLIGRFLGAEVLGLYFLGLILMQIANAVSRIGLPEGLLRFVAIHSGNGDLPRVKGTIVAGIFTGTVSSIVTAIILFFLASPLAVYAFKQPDLAFYVRWVALALPVFSVFILTMTTIQALKRMDLVVFARDFIQPLMMLSLGLAFFYFIPTSGSFLAGYLASLVAGLIASIYFLTRVCSPFGRSLIRISDAKIEWKPLLLFSLPITGSDLAYYFFRWADVFVLSMFRSAAEVGIYNAALRTTLLLTVLATSLNALYAPIVADYHHQGKYQQLEGILKTLMRWCLTLALPIVLAMGLLPGDILALWGPEFVAGSTALMLLAVSQLIFIACNILAFTLLMCGKQYLEFGNTVFITMLNIVVNLLLIPQYGMTGAAVALLSSQVVGFLLRLMEVWSFLNINVYSPKYLKPLVALIPVSVLIYVLQDAFLNLANPILLGSRLGVLAVMFAVIGMGYLMTLYVLGFEKEDFLLFKDLQVSRAIHFSRT
jgi:O-antigen/teichoic acid export membrane protein